MATPRVRFAPSPTGQVHIGNIRTAIFNWLFARHEGGSFLLRIEDTDRERSTDTAIAALIDVMGWLGLDYDETPLYQSSQADAHRAAAECLVAAGHAYRFAKGEGDGEATLFRIPWAVETVPFIQRGDAQEIELHADEPLVVDATGVHFATPSRKGKPVPTDACLAGFRELQALDADGNVVFELEPVIAGVLAGTDSHSVNAAKLRFRRHEVVYTDIVKGELRKPLDSMKDLVIVRSDGNPVFHLANVVDDITQGITHIVRGDDHVENTYRHLLMFHALGATAPAYAHLPMIINAAGKPFSKRDGDAYVSDFRDKGYLPDALYNYLTLLGWSPGDDREKMTRDELVAAFSLERVRSAPSQMDPDKLQHLNGQYIADLPPADFVAMARQRVADLPWMAGAGEAEFNAVAALMQSRTKSLSDVEGWSLYFGELPVYDEGPVQKGLAKEGVAAQLTALRQRLQDIPTFGETEVEAAIHATTDALELKQGKMNLAIRVAITGTNIGAGLYETLALLGRDRCLTRLTYAIDHLSG